MDDDLKPAQGSYPFSFSKDDFETTAYNTLLVATVASLHYVVGTVLPSITTTDPTILLAVTILTTALNSLGAYLGDTRPKTEQLRLPYSEVRRLRTIRKNRLITEAIMHGHGA